MNWIDKYRKERIRKGVPRYGKWEPKSFKVLSRDSLQEAIDEGIDLINYLNMAYLEKKISRVCFEMEKLEMEKILYRIINYKQLSISSKVMAPNPMV